MANIARYDLKFVFKSSRCNRQIIVGAPELDLQTAPAPADLSRERKHAITEAGQGVVKPCVQCDRKWRIDTPLLFDSTLDLHGGYDAYVEGSISVHEPSNHAMLAR